MLVLASRQSSSSANPSRASMAFMSSGESPLSAAVMVKIPEQPSDYNHANTGSTVIRMRRQIEIHHLEMTSPDDFRPSPFPTGFEVRQARIPSPELNRFFYVAVVGDWHWTDRLVWTLDEW